MLTAVRSKKFWILTLFFGSIYLLLSVYLTNPGLIGVTLFGSFSSTYKFSLLTALLLGLTTAMSRFSLFVLVSISVLTGANLALIFRKVNYLRANVAYVMVGGSSFLGAAGSGCVSCGLPILGALGLGGSIAYLPFKGAEISFLAIGLLIISFWMMAREKKVCKINS